MRAAVRWLLLALLLAMACTPAPRSNATAPTQPGPMPRPVESVAFPDHLHLGLAPVLTPESLAEGYGALCAELGRLLGTRVDLAVAGNYAELGDWVGRGEVQIAQLAPLLYVVAKEAHPGLRLLAAQIAEGGTDYAAYIVTSADSDVTHGEELRGRSFAFVDRTSASGYLYPLMYVWERYGDPAHFFSSVRFVGNHEELLREVATGRVDAGATFSGVLANYAGGGLGSAVRIVAKTGRVPYDAVVASPTLSEAQVAAVQSALLSIDTRSPRGRRALGPLRNVNGFLPGTDEHYDGVRTLLKRARQRGIEVGTAVGRGE